MVKAAILDFDGTLASSLDGIHLCMRECLVAFGLCEPSLADDRTALGLALEELLRILTHFECGVSTILALFAA